MIELHNTNKYNEANNPFMFEEGLENVLCSNDSLYSDPSLDIKEQEEFRLDELAEILLKVYLKSKINEKEY